MQKVFIGCGFDDVIRRSESVSVVGGCNQSLRLCQDKDISPLAIKCVSGRLMESVNPAGIDIFYFSPRIDSTESMASLACRSICRSAISILAN